MIRACLVVALIGIVPLLLDGYVQAGPAAATETKESPRAGATQSFYPLPPPPPDPPFTPVRPLPLLSPSPIVRIAGRVTRRGARVRVLSVRAPASATIVVRCRRRGCTRRSTARGRGMRRAVRLKRFQRAFRAGTIIEVLVGRVDAIGKFTRFRIRSSRSPARKELCLLPGASGGSQCPDV